MGTRVGACVRASGRGGYSSHVEPERWTMPAVAESPGAARRFARAFAARGGADAATVTAVALCVSEAVTNAVVHAYPAPGDGSEIELEARRPDGYLCFYVRDRGIGLQPRVGSPGLGLGLPIIAGSASALEVRTLRSGGTELAMRFDLAECPVAG